ncbi:hypothetical protein MMC26_001494 [Xylographa opegraphella]|nr:hypothetical protein [Xylographa opegraphella]
MTATNSLLLVNGLKQHPVSPAPSSPRRDFMPPADIPPIPQRSRDGHPRERTMPWMHESPVLRNGTSVPSQAQIAKAEARSPRSETFPSSTSKKNDPALPASHPEDGVDYKSSRGSSESSNGGDSYETDITPLSTLPTSSFTMYSNRSKAFEAIHEDFDLGTAHDEDNQIEMLEKVSELIFSPLHLQAIFKDPSALLKFTSFLSTVRPQSIPTLIYYLDATKALKAIRYANSIAKSLESLSSPELSAITTDTLNGELEAKAQRAFDLLVEKDLPAYTAHLYIQVVKASMMKPVAQGPQSSEASEGFAEVFCLTDPSRPDNPIVFASEAFHQMTQYSMNYIIGRNCRFLQGPKTNPVSLDRIRDAVAENKEHCEVILNYRRDGSPFLNLLMHAPLYDRSGKLRYFMGAQIDVSNVIDECSELELLQRIIIQNEGSREQPRKDVDDGKTEFQQFIETLDMDELKDVRTWEDRMLHESATDDGASNMKKPRRPGLPRNHHSEILKNGLPMEQTIGASIGLYNNYMLVRPFPSLRILFTSPSLDLPGMVQAPIMDKLGGSARVRHELSQALEDGREVTAKVRWKANEHEESQDRWIFFTPLIGKKGEIGVWMAILEDDIPDAMERVQQTKSTRRNFGTTSPIPEEHDLEEPIGNEMVPAHQNIPVPGPRDQLARTGSTASAVSTTSPRSPSLEFDRKSKAPSISGMTIDTILSEGDGEFVTLEERLRRKRERDMHMMLENPGIPLRKTYKSLSPDTFINTD